MHVPLVFLDGFAFDSLFERIYVCGLELSCTDLTLEEDVELSVRPARGLHMSVSKLHASKFRRRSVGVPHGFVSDGAIFPDLVVHVAATKRKGTDLMKEGRGEGL